MDNARVGGGRDFGGSEEEGEEELGEVVVPEDVGAELGVVALSGEAVHGRHHDPAVGEEDVELVFLSRKCECMRIYPTSASTNAPQKLLRALLHGLQIGEVEADEARLLPRQVLELLDDRLRALLVAAEHVHRRVALQEDLRDLLPDACIQAA